MTPYYLNKTNNQYKVDKHDTQERFFISTVPSSITCLIAGTLVELEDGSLVAIETVEVGQKVVSNEGLVTVLRIENPILGDRHLVGFNNIPAFFTSDHAVLTTNGWAAADPELYIERHPGAHKFTGDVNRLSVGDVLIGKNQNTAITKLVIEEGDPYLPLWDLTVNGQHTYFANNILVHNCDPCPFVNCATATATWVCNEAGNGYNPYIENCDVSCGLPVQCVGPGRSYADFCICCEASNTPPSENVLCIPGDFDSYLCTSCS